MAQNVDKDAPVVYDTELINKHGKPGQLRPLVMQAKKRNWYQKEAILY